MTIHYLRGENDIEELDLEEAQSRYARGEIRPDDYLFFEGLSDWVPAKDTIVAKSALPKVPPKSMKAPVSHTTDQPKPPAHRFRFSLMGLILGIAGVLGFFIFPLLGIPLAIAAVIFCHIAWAKKEDNIARPPKAILGLLLGYGVLVMTFALIYNASQQENEAEKLIDDFMTASDDYFATKERDRSFNAQNAIANRQVIPGMTRYEVVSSWGYPDQKSGTQDPQGQFRTEFWYYEDRDAYVTLHFSDDPSDSGRVWNVTSTR